MKGNSLKNKETKKSKIEKIREKELSIPLKKVVNNRVIPAHDKSNEISVIYPVKNKD